jgi:hypothetical protein
MLTESDARKVLDEITKLWPVGEGQDGPNLRDHDHEDLSPGSWSIDWEGGDAPYDWTFLFVDRQYESRTIPAGVFIEPINGVILGVYPA